MCCEFHNRGAPPGTRRFFRRGRDLAAEDGEDAEDCAGQLTYPPRRGDWEGGSYGSTGKRLPAFEEADSHFDLRTGLSLREQMRAVDCQLGGLRPLQKQAPKFQSRFV